MEVEVTNFRDDDIPKVLTELGTYFAPEINSYTVSARFETDDIEYGRNKLKELQNTGWKFKQERSDWREVLFPGKNSR